MINKNSIWFLTLSSIIFVLIIYYAVYPTDDKILTTFKSDTSNKTVQVEESDVLTAMRINKDEDNQKVINKAQEVLLNTSSTVDEKNNAYEQLQEVNTISSIEEKAEKIIKEEFGIASFVRIKDTNMQVVIDNKDDSYELVNKIIITLHSKLSTDYYITVKFE